MEQAPTKVVGRRVGAAVIDGLINAAINAIAYFSLTTTGPCINSGELTGETCRGFLVGSGDDGKQTLYFAIIILAPVLYYWILQGLTGWTLGKLAVGIRVVNAEGRPPGIWRAALRSLLVIVDGFPYLIPWLTGFIVALNSQRNQRVGDMAANTFVIDKNAVGAAPGQQQAGIDGGGGQQFGAPPASGPPPQAAAAAQKADWYPDPHGQARLRYWDGQRWTEHTSE